MTCARRTPIVVLATAAAVAFTAPVASAGTDTRCSGDFAANVRSGPDADLSLVGRLTIDIAGSGDLRGTLVQREGSKRIRVATVRGSAKDRTVELRFKTRSGKRIVGQGRAVRAIVGCSDLPAAGVLTGPRKGDRGDWGYAIGG